ncbi:MBOAT family O-acyltransferase [Butyrivibrio sp. INlla14]|uniref:MBOAT family O-acyltransferase n=1 Tax=Butyrivibrio sp. INlla14 TaxID=1520808 RepID=UPI0008768447|nr:MBOAT family O-acyltransferase [Butyrivibrio sp. INlla14]SCY72635.1 D-alanyl-lipoteichoic acid acyltransferase DltB, MBOAT superfamily [Butyrivibrio sp. INlla14]
MIYITVGYYFFVAFLVLMYYIVSIKYRWIVLLIGNLSFYVLFYQKAWHIIFATFCITFLIGKLMDNPRFRTMLLALGVLTIVLPWAFYKIDFLHGSIIAPLGISFYSLQLIAYLVDVYKGKIVAESNIFKFVLFAGFFPQIVQGPIPRYKNLQSQLTNGNYFDERKISEGFLYIIWGFFLKMMIADRAAVVVDTVFDNYQAYKGGYIWLGAFLYSIQLYTDFYSCTSLAKGVSKLFGIELVDNFARPYFASSVRDFWKRWHISLSSWLKDYIYIPLGGSRKGLLRKSVNLLITFMVSGVWHGAGVNFLMWGILHAFMQIIESFEGKRSFNSSLVKALIRIRTLLFVGGAWVIFRASNLAVGISMLRDMFIVWNPWIFFNDRVFSLGLDWKEMVLLFVSIALLFWVDLCNERGDSVLRKILEQKFVIRYFIYVFAIILIAIYGAYGYGYDSQEFIYGGF